MANRRIVRDRACAQCGTRPITGYKFCSKECQLAGKGDRGGYKPEWLEVNCSHCGRWAKRHWRGTGIRPTTCSKGCQTSAWAGGSSYVTAVVRREVAALRRIARRDKTKAARIAERRMLVKRRLTHSCADCGVGLDGSNLNRTICLGCSTERERAWKRKAKAARRAKERGLDAERFDPFHVFERDGWRCHLCGCKTPKRLRGTNEDNAPQLDHIIPLAAGGKHTRQNTACACRKCNITKADRPLGQLLLVA